MFFRQSLKKFSRSLLTELLANNPRLPTLSFATAGKFHFDSENSGDSERTNNYTSAYEQIDNILSKHETIPENSQWENFRKEIVEFGTRVNEKSVDATFMGYFTSIKNLNLAKSYMSYLEASNIQPNIATIGRFLKTYHAYFQAKEVPPEEKDNIFNWCQKLTKLGMLDATTAENVIHGLVLTKQWESSLKVLEMIKYSSRPTASILSLVIGASFSNGKPEIGWKFLNEMMEMDKPPKCNVYKSWIGESLNRFKIHNDSKQLLSDLETMLQFISRNDLLVSKEVAEEYLKAFQKLDWKGKLTTSVNGCRCKSCNRTFEPILLNETDFSRLQKEFLSKVLIRKDVFLRSSPQELNKFRETLARSAPYDIVIDGLNVAYTTGKKNPAELGNAVAAVMKHFLNNGKTVLVLGRKHMNRWPQISYIKKNANYFLAENLSQDDPFLLHAAIYSGPDTCFVSRDLMRGHRFLLEDNDMKDTFRKWQMSHQFQVVFVKNNGDVVFKHPLKYLQTAQRSKNSWHIPFIQEYSYNNRMSLEANIDWVCLQENTTR